MEFIYFNTSHVKVYRKFTVKEKKYQENFNTSHVKVYRVAICYPMFCIAFQYISC